jgi:hypothetical protein
MNMPTSRREPVDARLFRRFRGTGPWAAIATGALLSGCAANEASGPMKASPAAASKPIGASVPAQSATTVKATPSTATSTKPATPTAPRDARAATTAAPTNTRTSAAPSSPASAATSSASITSSAASAKSARPAPIVTKAPPAAATAPTPTAVPIKAPDPHAAAATSTVATADFSTGLLYPDPDPSTAVTRTVSLCEFKNGEWAPIMSAPVQTYGGDARGVTFRAVPVGRMVLPAYIVGDEVLPAANPWAVETSGKVRELKGPCATCPSNEPPILTLELRPAPADAANQRTTIEPGDYGLMAVRAERGRRYTLSYWDGAWKPIGEATVRRETPVRIEGIPSKRVLWLQSEGESLTLPVVP